MLNYKGMFYKEEKEKKYYEGGAHFKYSLLVRALLELQNQMKSNSETINSNSEKSDSVFDTNSIYRIKDNDNISNKEVNINQYILTLNNRKDKTFHNKGSLSNEKNLREKDKKKKFLDLLNLNLKIFPIKNNSNSKRKNYMDSLDKNYRIKSIKQLGINNNNDNNNNNLSNRTNKYLKTQINHIKNEYNFGLPLIQSYYFNNLANKSILEKNKDNNKVNNLKISIFSPMKLKLSKNYKVFPKNPIVSPKKQIHLGKSLLNEFETNKNSKNFDTIEMGTINNRHYFEKIKKILNSNKSKQKRINNIDLMLYNN
jgi:hypothetical protein